MSLLEVQNLHTHFISRNLDHALRVAKALNGVSFKVDEGEILGLVGETGAGKSLTAQSIMGLLTPPAVVVEGEVKFMGRDLITAPPEEVNKLRGNEIGMIVQSPLTSLNPLQRIGKQLIRVQRAHSDVSRRDARVRAIEMLETVGIPEPERRAHAWPHELSGGMAQRVLIAMALINGPRLLLADEPTTGLDVTVQGQILDLLHELVVSRNMGAVIITHDLGIVAHHCNRMAVMFAGNIIEQGPVERVFEAPQHPYTRSLIAATPKQIAIHGFKHIGGPPPDLYNLPVGCHFRDRCSDATDVCRKWPPLRAVADDHEALCHFPKASGTSAEERHLDQANP